MGGDTVFLGDILDSLYYTPTGNHRPCFVGFGHLADSSCLGDRSCSNALLGFLELCFDKFQEARKVKAPKITKFLSVVTNRARACIVSSGKHQGNRSTYQKLKLET